MKEIWLTPKDIAGKYNCPKTVQGVSLRAKNENWPKRKAKGKKGGGYEYEASNVINKCKLLKILEKNKDNYMQELTINYDTSDKKLIKATVDNDFFKNYIIVSELEVDTSDASNVKVTANNAGPIILSKQFVERQGLSSIKLATFIAGDDSMADTIKAGDTLLVSIYDERQQAKALDGIYVILFNNVLMVKRLQYKPIEVAYKVISDNSNYQSFAISPKEEPTFKVIAKYERLVLKK